MIFRALSLSIVLFLAPIAALAGAGHDHGESHAPVDQTTATKNATAIIADIVKQNKLPESWGGIAATSVEKKVFGDKQEWVIVFVNKKITDAAKQKLYVFLTMSGEYVAVNYTGQ